MITTILPVYPAINPFWNSQKGLGCINAFLELCTEIGELDRILVVSSDSVVESIAKKNGLEFHSMEPMDGYGRNYTLKDSWRFAQKFRPLCSDLNDGLITIDHRNILLTKTFMRRAISVFKRSPKTSVISITPCNDYPVQYQSYHTFSDCVVFSFDKPPGKTTDFHQSATLSNLSYQTKMKISMNVTGAHKVRYRIVFQTNESEIKEYVAQVLPFTDNGPDFEHSTEVIISEHLYEIILDADKVRWSGIIIVLSVPSQTGEYNMVECFSPPRATWKLKTSRQQLFRKKDNQPMNGRQQFPEAYIYDGSFCALGPETLKGDFEMLNPNPVIFPQSKIVMDWVDYYYTVAFQQSSTKTYL